MRGESSGHSGGKSSALLAGAPDSELHCVPTPVVEPLVGYERDGRLHDRRSPVQGTLYHPVGVPPPFLPLLEPPHVLGPVAPPAPAPARRLRADHAPPHVRIQRRQTHP